MYKLLVLALVFAMIGALATSFRHLWRDNSGKTLYWLWWRVGIAVALILVIIFGFLTGQLGLNAPWHGSY